MKLLKTKRSQALTADANLRQLKVNQEIIANKDGTDISRMFLAAR